MTGTEDELSPGQTVNTAGIHRSSSDGYLVQMEKQKQLRTRVTYKAYSLKDYKQLRSDINLRGLGPDYTAIQETPLQARCTQPAQDRKPAAFAPLQIKSTRIKAGVCVLLESTTKPDAVLVSGACLPHAPLPITSQLKEGLCCALRWWMLYSQTGARGLEERDFSGFSQTRRRFSSFSRTQQADITRSMKNPLYWAVLVGMTILLMEQGLQLLSGDLKAKEAEHAAVKKNVFVRLPVHGPQRLRAERADGRQRQVATRYPAPQKDRDERGEVRIPLTAPFLGLYRLISHFFRFTVEAK
ncbi:hypothetical protein GBF38_019071 [Nibea albiflora]|uniref:Uncharacterized protein n=1 Tax=Nibea albiflora TaxID=240163 RepID=A0ACB7F1N3_NIBAL|nr:hypothetical protein GBF38_019071 [Nibea albiflora]